MFNLLLDLYPICAKLLLVILAGVKEMHVKTDFIRTRIEPHLKAEVHALLNEIGMTPSQAITLFYKQIQLKHGLPFDVSIPNAETAKTIQEARANKNLMASKDKHDLFQKLGLLTYREKSFMAFKG